MASFSSISSASGYGYAVLIALSTTVTSFEVHLAQVNFYGVLQICGTVREVNISIRNIHADI